MLKLIAVYTTTANLEDARTLAHALVSRKLVACAQITPIESVYHWQGKIQQEPEYRLMLKTTEKLYAKVEATIRELHSYELPAIYAVPVLHSDVAYAQWVELETRLII